MIRRVLLLFCIGFALANNSQASSSASNQHQWQGSVDYQVCFTPGDNCVKRLSHFIKQAKHSIFVQAYVFTSYDLANALINAKKRGVKVNMIMDDSQLDPHFHSSQRVMKWFKKEAHMPIWIDQRDGLAHNKVMIIDRHIVETGSFNYTYSAQKHNAENMIFLKGHQIASHYLNNWYRLKKHAKRLSD